MAINSKNVAHSQKWIKMLKKQCGAPLKMDRNSKNAAQSIK